MTWGAIGATVVTGVVANRAAKKQSQAAAASQSQALEYQSESEQRAIEEQRRQFDLARADTATQRRVGDTSLNYLSQLLVPGQGQTQRAQPQAFGSAGQPMPTVAPSNAPPVGGGGLYTPSATTGRGLKNLVGGVRDIATRGAGGTGLFGNAFAKLQAQQAPTTTGTAPYAPQPFEMGDFQTDPGYQFRLQQGAEARRNALAGGGMKLSGRAQKELERYGQDYGSAEYGKVYGRRMGEFQQAEQGKQNYLANLSRLAGYGATGIATSASAAQQAASGISQAALGAGANRANIASQYGTDIANIQGQKYANIGGAVTGGIQNYLAMQQQNKLMDLFKSPQQTPWKRSEGVWG